MKPSTNLTWPPSHPDPRPRNLSCFHPLCEIIDSHLLQSLTETHQLSPVSLLFNFYVHKLAACWFPSGCCGQSKNNVVLLFKGTVWTLGKCAYWLDGKRDARSWLLYNKYEAAASNQPSWFSWAFGSCAGLYFGSGVSGSSRKLCITHKNVTLEVLHGLDKWDIMCQEAEVQEWFLLLLDRARLAVSLCFQNICYVKLTVSWLQPYI